MRLIGWCPQSTASRVSRMLLLCGLLSLTVCAAAARAAVPLTVLSNDPYTNTTSFHQAEVEPASFAAGSTVVTAVQAGRFPDGGSSNIGWATSTDGASTWKNGFLPGTTVYAKPAGPYAAVSDEAVAFDAKHGVWMIVMDGLDPNYAGIAAIVSRSTDGGLTWGNPVTVQASTTQNIDKTWIVCDSHASSPYYGNCYAEWDDMNHNQQLHMAVSKNGGLTWTQSTVPNAPAVIGGQPVVQPSGKVIMPIQQAGNIVSFISSNGGSSYTGPSTIATLSFHTEAGSFRSYPLTSAGTDSTGKVYVAWMDCRFIANCTANDIVYSTSTDGTHWSAVTRIPIDTTTSGVDHFLPGLAVDPATSGATTKLALTYYYYPVSNCTESTCQLDVGFVRSSNAGATWTARLQLAGPMTMSRLPDTSLGYMIGDFVSTAFVTTSAGDAPTSFFESALAVSGKTCTLGDNSSCRQRTVAHKTAP
ncbi:MAG TPA: sialidase family protein [Solirubrobacteraceae bacterium]|nr:sialidase family protein [Solirubrobacteraceae bacterium]